MTNFEKYKNEIAAIVESGDRVAIDRNTKKPVPCKSLGDCPECLLGDPTRTYDECYAEFVKWLIEEYVEPRFSEEDILLARALKGKGATAICKDGPHTGDIYVYDAKGNLVLKIYESLKSFENIEAFVGTPIDDIIKEGGYGD